MGIRTLSERRSSSSIRRGYPRPRPGRAADGRIRSRCRLTAARTRGRRINLRSRRRFPGKSTRDTPIRIVKNPGPGTPGIASTTPTATIEEAEEVLRDQSRPAKDRMPVNPEVARVRVGEVGGGKADEQNAHESETADGSEQEDAETEENLGPAELERVEKRLPPGAHRDHRPGQWACRPPGLSNCSYNSRLSTFTPCLPSLVNRRWMMAPCRQEGSRRD